MNTFTIITEETPAPEVTQATERIFIQDLPVTYTGGHVPLLQALYVSPAAYGKRHYITLGDITEVVAADAEITPSRSLNDQEMIMYLTNELYEASKEADIYRERAVRIIADLEVIAEALRDEAESRGWCDDYNEFVSKVSEKTSEHHLLPLEQEYEVNVEVEATVRTTRTISVLARSLEDAQEMVADDPEAFFDPNEEAIDAARAGGFDDLELNLA